MAHLKQLTRDRLPGTAIEITDKAGCQRFEGGQAKKCEMAVKAGVTVVVED